MVVDLAAEMAKKDAEMAKKDAEIAKLQARQQRE